jgi:thymidylate kinase
MRRASSTQTGQRIEDAGPESNAKPTLARLSSLVLERKKTERSLPSFLLALFQLLNENGLRYCVLHSWQNLPDELPGDLDLAVVDEDKLKLLRVFEGLQEQGYVPIQTLNYSEKGNAFVFFWTDPSGGRTATIDIVSEHRRGGRVLATAEDLVANRRRHGAFWIASPQTEFAYLLAKKAFKRKASENQARRLLFLTEELGTVEAEKLAISFLPGDSNRQAVESCMNGSIDDFLRDAHTKLWRVSLTRSPWKLVPYFGAEAWRVVRRWFQPTGLVVAILGPDGVGKSTVISGMVEPLGMAFRCRHRIFHWRPNVMAPKPDMGPVPDPHGKPARGTLASMLYLSGFFLDYWVGFLFRVRPLIAKSNLVLFDRYFHDVLVDPRRYRYGGPDWFARFLSRLVPEPDLVIVLDTDTESIRERKCELAREEIDRQRKAYLDLGFKRSERVVVDTSADAGESICSAATAVAGHMRRRLTDRGFGWLSAVARVGEESEIL